MNHAQAVVCYTTEALLAVLGSPAAGIVTREDVVEDKPRRASRKQTTNKAADTATSTNVPTGDLMSEKAFYALKAKDKDAAKAYLHKAQDMFGVERGQGYRAVLAAAGSRTAQVSKANKATTTSRKSHYDADRYASVTVTKHRNNKGEEWFIREGSTKRYTTEHTARFAAANSR